MTNSNSPTAQGATAIGYRKCSDQNLRRKERRRSWQEASFLRKCAGEDVESAEGAVGEAEKRRGRVRRLLIGINSEALEFAQRDSWLRIGAAKVNAEEQR
jgi:hypothetical protein